MQVSLCTRFPHLLKTRTVLSRRIQGTRLTPPTLGSPKNITVVFKAFKKNENKSHQVDILLVLTDVGFFFEKSWSEQIRFKAGSECTGDAFADTFGAQQKSPMLFLLTQEIIKMWNKLFVCKLCKTLKDSLERRKRKKEHAFTHASVLGLLEGSKV